MPTSPLANAAADRRVAAAVDPASAAAIRFGYADTRFGQLHYAECGSGAPIVLLHQTPRSWDEYREVLPLLGRSFRAFAPDTLGFGASAPAPQHSIETYAEGVLAFLDAMNLPEVMLVGHHTGGVIAIEVAARAPDRIRRLVLSSTPFIDAAARGRRSTASSIDGVEVADDGAHLTELWQRRLPYYPTGRPDILTRFVRDALRLDPADLEAGHAAVGRYRMEARITRVSCPVLCIGAADDPFAFPDIEPLRRNLANSRIETVADGMIPLMEQSSARVAELIAGFGL